jgi:hypothetical protein
MTRLQRAGLGLLLAYLVALTVRLALTARLGHDDIEHLHSAWLMVQGQQPFLDFFQKQSPLFWWMLAPVVQLSQGSLSAAVFLGRGMMLLVLASSVWAVTLLARQCCQHRRYGVAAVVITLASPVLLYNLLVIRPDGVMVALLLWALVAVSRHLGRRSQSSLFVAGVLLGLASVLLLKAVPVAVAMAAVVAWFDMTQGQGGARRVIASQGLLLGGGLTIVVPFLLLLAGLGLLESFTFFNVTFNGELYRNPWPGDVGWFTRVTSVVTNELRQEPWLLVLTVLACGLRPRLLAGGRRQQDRVRLLILVSLLVTSIIVLLLNRLPFYSYFLLPLLSGAILAPALVNRLAQLTSGHQLQWTSPRRKLSLRLFPTLMVLFTLGVTLAGGQGHNRFATNEGQLDKLSALSRVSGPYQMPDHPVFALDNRRIWDNVQRYQFTFRRLESAGRVPADIAEKYRREW